MDITATILFFNQFNIMDIFNYFGIMLFILLFTYIMFNLVFNYLFKFVFLLHKNLCTLYRHF